MNFDDIQSILISLLLVGVGLFIKTTEHKNFQDVKKWGKPLVIIGSIGAVLKIIALSMK